MTLLPVADGARLLGIHPKTLHHWLKEANLPLATHPTDARITCVTEEHLQQVARLHDRPLQASRPLDAASPAHVPSQISIPHGPENEGKSASTACSFLTSYKSEADLTQKLSGLETKIATLQEQIAQLTLALLQERERDRLSSASRPSSPSCKHAEESRCPICRFQSLDTILLVWCCRLKRSIPPNNWLGRAGLL